MTMQEDKRVCLGAIVGVHGIKGEVKVKSWTAKDRDIGSYGVLQDKSGNREFCLKVVGHSKELLRCKIKGIDDRNAAEALIGTELYINRKALPDLAEEEYYQTDLIGLRVLAEPDLAEIGQVTGIYNFGAGDILEIKISDTGKTEMIPFTKVYVPKVNIKEGYVVVSGALSDFADEEEADEN